MAGIVSILVAALLHWTTPLRLLDALLLSALMVLLPSLAVAQLRMLREEPLERVPVYLGSMVTLFLLGGSALVVGWRSIGLAGMGLGPVTLFDFLFWTAALTAAGLLLIGLFHAIGQRLGIDETRILAELLPRTAGEKLLFSALSLSAGIGEELAYRAYAITIIALALGTLQDPATPASVAALAPPADVLLWVGAALSSVAFGFLHAYQSMIGVVRTGLLGFALAASFLISGSLWPAVAAHTLIDLIAGLVIGKRLLRHGRDHGN